MTDQIAGALLAVAGVALIVWGAEAFAEHLAGAATRLGVTTFALALLLAGAEPEELATAVAATVRESPAIAFGDVVGANVTICLVALGVGALVAPLPFGRRVLRYGVLALPLGVLAVAFAWDGRVGRAEGGVLVAGYVAYVAGIWLAERGPRRWARRPSWRRRRSRPPGVGSAVSWSWWWPAWPPWSSAPPSSSTACASWWRPRRTKPGSP